MSNDEQQGGRDTQVVNEVNRLRSTADAIESLVGALEDRIAPVTRDLESDPPVPGKDEPNPEPVVLLAGKLGGIRLNLQDLSERLASLLDRCEL